MELVTDVLLAAHDIYSGRLCTEAADASEPAGCTRS